jgi:hypothetical protein
MAEALLFRFAAIPWEVFKTARNTDFRGSQPAEVASLRKNSVP